MVIIGTEGGIGLNPPATWLARIGTLPTDTEEERLKKSLLTIVGAALIACGAMWAGMYVALHEPVAAMIPGGFSVLSSASLAYFAFTKRYAFYRFSLVFLMLILPPALHWALGGFVASSAVIVWAVLSPMGALMFAGRRPAIVAFVSFLVLLTLVVLFGPHVAEGAARIPPLFRTALFIMNVGGTLSILFFAMQFFAKERDAAIGEVRLQNAALAAGVRKLEDLNSTKDRLFHKLSRVNENLLPHLGETLDQLKTRLGEPAQKLLQHAIVEVDDLLRELKPISIRYSSEQAMRSKRLLLADSDPKRQVVAKMALAGTGVALDVTGRLDEALKKIESTDYDLLCLDAPFIDLAARAMGRNPSIKTVYMVSDGIKGHLLELVERPYLSNVLCTDEQDRMFTVKNISTTVAKLATGDLFGLEKYLGWGVEVQELPVRSSETRHLAINQMEEYLRKAGLSGLITRRAVLVAEELLSNAIFDAPADESGKPLFVHLPRTTGVELLPQQQPMLRFASDGLMAGISVSDPFGRLTRQTILDYLISCYSGSPGSMQTNKGGAGRGLFQIMEASSLVVFNVKEGRRTEVCSLLNLELQVSKRMNERSFHFFYG